ncbi:MBL fold metallo-hydrolase [Paenibacillus ginsengihumi]|uniref:MBL fold metallo-hydrolase n=1 Tax=Paenibacillus ginsengihumi TaxID=431596 RepID=UPI0003A88B29|nr:ribonuclease Z [Paenibacillus ginsengihumi]
MMKVTLLGTSSAAGSRERDNTYLLLEHDQDAWMIDVGGNPLGKLKQAGMPLDRIRGVILTHFHIDHIFGLPSLLWGMWLGGRQEALTVYCDAGHAAQLQQILASYRTSEWPIGFAIDIRTFDWTKPSTLFAQGELSVSVFPSLHVGATVGVRAAVSERVLVYSADTRPNEWIAAQQRIDVLVHEATAARGAISVHTSLEQLVRFYPLERIGRVVAVHLTDDEPYGDVLAECEARVRERIALGADLMSFPV